MNICNNHFAYNNDLENQIKITMWNNLSSSTIYFQSRDGTRSRLSESNPAGFCVYLSDPESKIWEKTSTVSSEISDLCKILPIFIICQL